VSGIVACLWLSIANQVYAARNVPRKRLKHGSSHDMAARSGKKIAAQELVIAASGMI
jgi:hypothetical protein